MVGATLIGNGPDILTKVTRIGHDLKLDEGVGVCAKAGQSVPVGVGLPTMLVSEITVGGTRAVARFAHASARAAIGRSLVTRGLPPAAAAGRRPAPRPPASAVRRRRATRGPAWPS